MKTQPLQLTTEVIVDVTTETNVLAEHGFTSDEILSLFWLRQWYQNGGSDRVEIVRRLEFLKLLVLNDKIDVTKKKEIGAPTSKLAGGTK